MGKNSGIAAPQRTARAVYMRAARAARSRRFWAVELLCRCWLLVTGGIDPGRVGANTPWVQKEQTGRGAASAPFAFSLLGYRAPCLLMLLDPTQ